MAISIGDTDSIDDTNKRRLVDINLVTPSMLEMMPSRAYALRSGLIDREPGDL